ncbi:unnamed protein product [Amaranthus hypochondriacus]
MESRRCYSQDVSRESSPVSNPTKNKIDKSIIGKEVYTKSLAFNNQEGHSLLGKVEAVDKLLDHVDINSNDQEDHFDPHRGGVNHALGESLNQSTDCEVHADGVFIPADIPKGEAMPSVAVIETRN